MVPPPSYSCDKSRDFIQNLDQQKLMQFLGGLNENYNHLRSQILMMSSIPSVNKAYSLIIDEESQRAHLNMAAQISRPTTHYEDGEPSVVAAAAAMRHDQNSKQKGIMTSRYDSRYEVGESSGSTNVNDIY